MEYLDGIVRDLRPYLMNIVRDLKPYLVNEYELFNANGIYMEFKELLVKLLLSLGFEGKLQPIYSNLFRRFECTI